MMNDAEIQIQFPQPGKWEEFTLTAIYQDKGGYRPPARYTQDEIPAGGAGVGKAGKRCPDPCGGWCLYND